MNPIQVGYTILSLIVAVALIVVGLLVGGVLDSITDTVYKDLKLNGTKWDQMRQTAVGYAQTGINIVLVAIILTAVGVLLAVVFGFVGGIGVIKRGVAEFVEFMVRIGNYIVYAAKLVVNIITPYGRIAVAVLVIAIIPLTQYILVPA